MITWSTDKHLGVICSDMNKYIAGYDINDYYIYGMQQTDRPHVKISPEPCEQLATIFKMSGYTSEFATTNSRYCSACDDTHTLNACHCPGDGTPCVYCDQNVTMIGLRLDVRQDKVVARQLIKTIIFAMEGKLITDKTSRLDLGTKVKRSAHV
jgi:hypothetical protein